MDYADFGSRCFLLKCFLPFAFLLRLVEAGPHSNAAQMPLSQEQVDALKNPRTVIAYQEQNPKAAGTKAWERHEKYKVATTVAEAKDKKAGWQDLTSDFEKGFLKSVEDEHMDIPSLATKRPAPEGTPDKEAQARSKSQPSDIVPRALPTEAPDAISKVEMSAATIATLRMVMREEIASGMQEMENRMCQKMEEKIGQVKAELVAEKEAREALEARVRQLENSPPTIPESVDKSQVVIGGFQGVDGEETEQLVSDVLMHVDGFHGAHTMNPNATIAMAQFTTAASAMKFIRGQKFNPKMREHKLWASENRSPEERRRCKIIRKIKRALIEHGRFDPKNGLVSYKSFIARIRLDRSFMNIANVNPDGNIEWLGDDGVVNSDVKEAMAEFVDMME